jgi:Carboxypeptidase regulatory-like domain
VAPRACALAYVIRGTVRDAGGLPVPQARAYFVSGPGSFPDTAAVTDEHGEFTLAAPSGGSYRIGCSADDYDSQVAPVELTQAEPAHVEIRLNRRRQ